MWCCSDARESANAAAVYIRQWSGGTGTGVLQKSSSSNQASDDYSSIGTNRSRDLNIVVNQRCLVVSDVFLWSDSQFVLYCVHSSKHLPAYVDHRKNEMAKTDPILDYVSKLGYVHLCIADYETLLTHRNCVI